MSEARTSNSGEFGRAAAPAPARYKAEIELVDDKGDPVAGITYWITNKEIKDNNQDPITGKVDQDGIIQLDNLAALDITLTIEAQALADEMEKRTLKDKWITPYQMKMTPAGVDKGTGNIIYQVVIGQLCNKFPTQEIARKDKEARRIVDEAKWVKKNGKEIESDESSFHFPDPSFSGLTIPAMHIMNQRVIVKICPFRAWNLVLHHQKEYSMVNAHNLGVMANLTYENKDFFYKFLESFWDLSVIPSLKNERQSFYAVVKDVPYSEGYIVNQFLDTTNFSDGKDEGDTQLYYIANKTTVLVAWRGSQEKLDWVMNFTFRPISRELKLGANKGFVHKGFWESFDVARKKFQSYFDDILSLCIGGHEGERKLFICGHSLGGALSTIYSATMRKLKPLVYTYGMPRVFTYGIVRQLQEVVHYRHVNDGDLVTFVPPQAELDSKFYDIWGSAGTFFGTIASLTQWGALSTDIDEEKKNELYVHHGNVVLFFKAQQSVVYNIKPPENNEEGLQEFTIRGVLPKEVKFYLVSTLSNEQYAQSEECQRNFIDCADKQSLQEFFSAYKTPKIDTMIWPLDHFMPDRYIPFLNNQLIELVDKERSMTRKKKREEFISQMKKHEANLSIDEKKRNQLFISMQSALQDTLTVTREMDGGDNALSRFKQAAKEDVEK